MQQLLVHLPEELLSRFRRRVSVRQRSEFVRQLLDQALPPDQGDDDPLYQAALAVEQDTRLAAEMAEWEETMLGDGLAPIGETPPHLP